MNDEQASPCNTPKPADEKERDRHELRHADECVYNHRNKRAAFLDVNSRLAHAQAQDAA